MAKSDTRRTKGQAKPRKERDPPGAVRKGKDAKTGGGGGACCDYLILDSEGGARWAHTGERAFQSLVPGNNKPEAGRTKSSGPVGMETGANSGRPVGEGAEAEGGEREAGLSDRSRSEEACGRIAEWDDFSRYYNRGIYRAESFGIAGDAKARFANGFAYGARQQDREAARYTRRWAGAALLIGITLGVLLPLAYQMVSRG